MKLMQPNNHYAIFICEHLEDIYDFVNQSFESKKNEIRTQLLAKIKQYIQVYVTHYEWEYDGCPYDHSGVLLKSGIINLSQTVNDYLENEYTGEWEATYISHYGQSYKAIGDELSYFTLELGYKIMTNAIIQYIEDNLMITLTTSEIESLSNEDYLMDDIYSNTTTFNFFSWEYPIEFCNIGELLLSNI